MAATRTNATATRSNTKCTTDQKRRVRLAWAGLPCAWCLLPGSWDSKRTGRGDADMTMGHLVPFVTCRTYAPHVVAPQCGACQKATGSRDVSHMVAAGPNWQAVTDAAAKAWAAAGHDPATKPRPTNLATREQRDAARKARLGY